MSNLETLQNLIHEGAEENNLDFSYILDQLTTSILESTKNGA